MFLMRVVMLSLVAVLAGCMVSRPGPGGGGLGATVTPVSARQRPAAPELKRLGNGHYRVRKPWTVVLNGRSWQVQKGYTCNGITAPESVKSALGDGPQHPETWAAVFHDWLFTQPGVSRGTADDMFYDLLLAYGVPQSKARLMHASVAAYSLSKVIR